MVFFFGLVMFVVALYILGKSWLSNPQTETNFFTNRAASVPLGLLLLLLSLWIMFG